LLERCAGKKNFLYAFALHDDRIIMRDRSAAAAEHFDVVRAFLAQQTNNFSEKFDVPAVVARDTDRASVLLACGAHTVAYRAMIPEINHLDAMANEFQVYCIDGAVVPIANRDSG